MSVLFTISDGYTSQTAACNASTCANNKGADQTSFYIITDSLESEVKLESFAPKYCRSLSVIPISGVSVILMSQV